MSHEVELKALAEYLEQNHLKHTKQRELILSAFLEAKRHITSDDLYQKVREQHSNIGYTTVYEFECEMIEQTQNEIAARHEFQILRHRHELYGHCRDCRED